MSLVEVNEAAFQRAVLEAFTLIAGSFLQPSQLSKPLHQEYAESFGGGIRLSKRVTAALEYERRNHQ